MGRRDDADEVVVVVAVALTGNEIFAVNFLVGSVETTLNVHHGGVEDFSSWKLFHKGNGTLSQDFTKPSPSNSTPYASSIFLISGLALA